MLGIRLRVSHNTFSAAALVVRAAVLVVGVGSLGSDTVATSAGVSLAMPGSLMTAYVSNRR
jgi:hypothetical protein